MLVFVKNAWLYQTREWYKYIGNYVWPTKADGGLSYTHCGHGWAIDGLAMVGVSRLLDLVTRLSTNGWIGVKCVQRNVCVTI